MTTFETEWPHAVHKDFMTHGFPKNFQSFRTFPPEKVIQRVEDDPFVPEVFYERATGMSHGKPLADQVAARNEYFGALEESLWHAHRMLKLGVSKDQINFLLQDYSFIRGVVTATEWDNFFGLRADPDNVRPEVRKVALEMNAGYLASIPMALDYGEWHLPFTTEGERAMCFTDEREDRVLALSVGRTARISYLTHHGERDPGQDVRLHDDLLTDGHMSPFGHQATPLHHTGPKYIWREEAGRNFKFNGPDWSGALYGWAQYRKTIPYEHNYREYKLYA